MSTVERNIFSEIPAGYTPEEWAQIKAEREALVAECLASLKREPVRRDVDENGSLLPTTPEEREARSRRFQEMVEEWKTWPEDDPPGAHDEALRGIDEVRRASGMRTLFDKYFEP